MGVNHRNAYVEIMRRDKNELVVDFFFFFGGKGSKKSKFVINCKTEGL